MTKKGGSNSRVRQQMELINREKLEEAKEEAKKDNKNLVKPPDYINKVRAALLNGENIDLKNANKQIKRLRTMAANKEKKEKEENNNLEEIIKPKPKIKTKPKSKKVVAKGLSDVEKKLIQQRVDIGNLQKEIDKLRKKGEKTKAMTYKLTTRRTSKRLAIKREDSKRQASKREDSKRQASKRQASKREASKRQASKR